MSLAILNRLGIISYAQGNCKHYFCFLKNNFSGGGAFRAGAVGNYIQLTRPTPLIHRCSGPPSPVGKVKSFPSGRCVAQRIESKIAAGGSYTIKSGAALASARLRRGIASGCGWKLRTAHSSNAPHPSRLSAGHLPRWGRLRERLFRTPSCRF